MSEISTVYNIDELYKNLLPSLRDLEEERVALSKKLDKLKKMSILGSAVVVVVSFPWLGIMSPIFFGALGLAAYTVLYHKMKKNYKQGYKDKVFSKMVGVLGDQYGYDLNGQISDDVLMDSGLFHDFNKKQCEDHISGKFDGHTFEMAELNLYKGAKAQRVDRGGGLHYIFKGLFFVGTIPLSFPTKIWILSKNHPETYGESRIKDHWQKVELKHLAFRKEYMVYTENKETAYKVLPDQILDLILKTREEVVDDKMLLELSFQANQVFLSISTTRELFEPPINTSILDQDDFRSNFKYLVNTTRLLQKLTLVKV